MEWLATERGRKLARHVEYARQRFLVSSTACSHLCGTAYPRDVDCIKTITSNFEEDIAVYNDARAFQRVYLQAVCEQMYYTLPREVRDMIYEHLHWEYDSTNPQAEIVRYAACIDDPSEPGGLGLGLSTDHSFPLSPNVPYWDETIVGPSVFFEIAQAWYRKVNLDPDLLVYGNLNDYLDRDRWDLGLRPADMMEHVSILVHPEHIVNPRYRKSLLGLMSLRPSCCVEFVLLDRLKRVQRCLGCHKVAIASNLRVSPPPFILSNLHAGLHVWDPLLPIAEKLKASGMRLSVSLKYCDLKLALYRHGCDDVLSIKQWRTVAKVAQQSLLEGNTVNGVKLICLKK